jgi:hypothetical protein
VVDIPGKGKGVVVTRDMERGTLLMAAKPLAWSDANKELREIPVVISRQERLAGACTKAHLMLDAVRFVRNNPLRASEPYSLWDGEQRTGNSVPQGVIDTRGVSHAGVTRLHC